jgi:hypothetical protein
VAGKGYWGVWKWLWYFDFVYWFDRSGEWYELSLALCKRSITDVNVDGSLVTVCVAGVKVPIF